MLEFFFRVHFNITFRTSAVYSQAAKPVTGHCQPYLPALSLCGPTKPPRSAVFLAQPTGWPAGPPVSPARTNILAQATTSPSWPPVSATKAAVFAQPSVSQARTACQPARPPLQELGLPLPSRFTGWNCWAAAQSADVRRYDRYLVMVPKLTTTTRKITCFTTFRMIFS